jgi:hypothetical protein
MAISFIPEILLPKRKLGAADRQKKLQDPVEEIDP